MFNHFNTFRKFRGGENRKTEIRGRGGRGGGFVYLYYSTIICNGGQRGWGSGIAFAPVVECSSPCHRPHLLPDYCQLPLATPMDCSTNGFLQWIRGQSILSLHLSSEGFLVHSLCVRSVKNAMRCYTGVIICACCIA